MLLSPILVSILPLASAVRPTSIETPAPIVHEADLLAPPAEVWRVFSTGEGFRKLGPALADVDLRLGGLIRSRYDANGSLDDEGAIHNEILAFEPERMIAFKIHRPPKGFPYPNAWKSTWSVVTLTDLGDGRTHLRDAMLGFGDDEESKAMRAFFDRGNGWTIEKLRAGFEAAATTGQAPRGANAPRK